MAGDWTILSNHGLVLVTLARQPHLRIRDVADLVGITERAAQSIVNDLVDQGYLERLREGRRNRYLVRGDRPLRHPMTRDHEVADLIHALVPGPLVPPSRSSCLSIVLSCSDYRFLEPLRNLLAEEGLLERSEVLLWPGGGSALAGPDGGRILAVLQGVVQARGPERLLLVAHHGCSVRGAVVARHRDPFTARQAVVERRRRAAQRVRRRLRLRPETWFLDDRGAHRVRIASPVRPRPDRHLEGVAS